MLLAVCSGLGLLDRSFESHGFTVVRGPDILWGSDLREFHAPPHTFEGVIGGPPCQAFSVASGFNGTDALDLIPDFVRICQEAKPSFIVMENVLQAVGHEAIPSEWHQIILSDWDCGGETYRRRAFWSYPFKIPLPPLRPGTKFHRSTLRKQKNVFANGIGVHKPSRSVMANSMHTGPSSDPAKRTKGFNGQIPIQGPSQSVMGSSGKRGNTEKIIQKGFLPGDLPLEEYARLQGYPEFADLCKRFEINRHFAIKLLGNGVPRAMGMYVAKHAAEFIKQDSRSEP